MLAPAMIESPGGARGGNEVVTKLFSANSQEKVDDMADRTHGSRFANSAAVLSGVEECLRQFGGPKHIRDAL